MVVMVLVTVTSNFSHPTFAMYMIINDHHHLHSHVNDFITFVSLLQDYTPPFSTPKKQTPTSRCEQHHRPYHHCHTNHHYYHHHHHLSPALRRWRLQAQAEKMAFEITSMPTTNTHMKVFIVVNVVVDLGGVPLILFRPV